MTLGVVSTRVQALFYVMYFGFGRINNISNSNIDLQLNISAHEIISSICMFDNKFAETKIPPSLETCFNIQN